MKKIVCKIKRLYGRLAYWCHDQDIDERAEQCNKIFDKLNIFLLKMLIVLVASLIFIQFFNWFVNLFQQKSGNGKQICFPFPFFPLIYYVNYAIIIICYFIHVHNYKGGHLMLNILRHKICVYKRLFSLRLRDTTVGGLSEFFDYLFNRSLKFLLLVIILLLTIKILFLLYSHQLIWQCQISKPRYTKNISWFFQKNSCICFQNVLQ